MRNPAAGPAHHPAEPAVSPVKGDAAVVLSLPLALQEEKSQTHHKTVENRCFTLTAPCGCQGKYRIPDGPEGQPGTSRQGAALPFHRFVCRGQNKPAVPNSLMVSPPRST